MVHRNISKPTMKQAAGLKTYASKHASSKKLKNTLLVFKKSRSCTDKLHIKWTGLSKAGLEGGEGVHM